MQEFAPKLYTTRSSTHPNVFFGAHSSLQKKILKLQRRIKIYIYGGNGGKKD